MTTLQQQADSAFADTNEDITTQRAAADAANTRLGYQDVKFADEGGDEPSPVQLEYDGKGVNTPVSEIMFADDEAAPSAADTLPAQAAPERKPDLHAPDKGQPVDSSRQEFDQELLARAKMYGVADERSAAQYESPEQLEKALLAIDQQAVDQYQSWRQARQYHDMMQRLAQQPSPFASPMQVPAPVQSPPAAFQQQSQWTQEERRAAAELEAFRLSNPDVYDEILANDLHGLADHTVKQIQQQHQELNQLRSLVEQQQAYLAQTQARQQQEAVYREQLDFDDAVRTLGTGWDEVFGEDNAQRMDLNSPEIANRRKIYETAKVLQDFHASQGRYVRLRDVLPSSLSINFPDRNAAATSTARPDRQRDTHGRFVAARPTRRSRGSNVSPRESALSKWDSMFAKAGMPGDFGVEGGIADI